MQSYKSEVQDITTDSIFQDKNCFISKTVQHHGMDYKLLSTGLIVNFNDLMMEIRPNGHMNYTTI